MDETLIVILIYVDDDIIIGTNSHRIQEVKKCLNEKFSIKDLRVLNYFLSIEVARISDGLVLSKRKFTLDI